MKIAVGATGKDLDSSIDQRFGRCRYFMIIIHSHGRKGDWVNRGPKEKVVS